ncbi:MAG: class I SAM-dependent methyltransferase [Candidatus Actinomarina sp.]|nr:class I SAM-dependent methyltransferase [Candidatus Actinomarina sp.]
MSRSANFSKIYRFYDGINSLLTLGFDRSWRERASKKLSGTTVLDLGSGTGAAEKQLVGYEVTALDPDKRMLSLNNFSNKIVGSAEALPFDDKSFDNVYCAFVWRNVSDTDKAFEEIRRVLKDGGRFVLLDMTRPLNTFTKLLHKLGTFITLHLIGILTFNFKQYRFLYTSLDKLETPEVFLKKSVFNNYSIERMGIFGFVYLAVLKS